MPKLPHEALVELVRQVLLKLLQLRGLVPDEAQRRRILACRDEAVLEIRVTRVLTAGSLDELLAGTA